MSKQQEKAKGLRQVDIMNFALQGYMAAVPPEDRGTPESNGMFGIYVSANKKAQKFRYLKLHMKREGLYGKPLSFTQVTEDLSDDNVFRRIKGKALKDVAEITGNAHFAQRELMEAFDAFVKEIRNHEGRPIGVDVSPSSKGRADSESDERASRPDDSAGRAKPSVSRQGSPQAKAGGRPGARSQGSGDGEETEVDA